MEIKKLVALRIKELCENQDIALNTLANRSGITPSTLYSLTDSKRNDVGIVTIKKLCDGLEITLAEFFNTDSFDSLEQEIK